MNKKQRGPQIHDLVEMHRNSGRNYLSVPRGGDTELLAQLDVPFVAALGHGSRKRIIFAMKIVVLF